MDSSWSPALRVIHVVGVLLFLGAHAISVFVAFRVKALADRAEARRLLDRSLRAVLVTYVALLTVLVSGILAGIAGAWFTSGRWWIWVALVLLIVVGGLMYPLATKPLMRVRWAAGARLIGKPETITRQFGDAPPTEADYRAALAAWNPWLPLAIGLIGLVVLIWLMLAKPF